MPSRPVGSSALTGSPSDVIGTRSGTPAGTSRRVVGASPGIHFPSREADQRPARVTCQYVAWRSRAISPSADRGATAAAAATDDAVIQRSSTSLMPATPVS